MTFEECIRYKKIGIDEVLTALDNYADSFGHSDRDVEIAEAIRDFIREYAINYEDS